MITAVKPFSMTWVRVVVFRGLSTSVKLLPRAPWMTVYDDLFDRVCIPRDRPVSRWCTHTHTLNLAKNIHATTCCIHTFYFISGSFRFIILTIQYQTDTVHDFPLIFSLIYHIYINVYISQVRLL